MTQLYFTIDTEYAAAITTRGGNDTRRENFDRSIAGRTADGEVGIGYQMDVFDRHGMKAVFFVDPMPALIWGVEAIADVVGPIAARGHDVQLHIHTEWLEIAGSANFLGGTTGQNIRNFAFEDQCRLLEYARDVLIAAGAPRPIAFRAGNYGANDDTLRALAEIGLRYDTSHCPGFPGSACAITLGPQDTAPLEHHGVVEVPVSAISAGGGALRHLQLTAVSGGEMIAALRHAKAQGEDTVTLVSHSFELMSRDRKRTNRVVRRRFEQFCAAFAKEPGVGTGTYAANPPQVAVLSSPPLPHAPLRTGLRHVEQALSNALYGAK